MILSYQIPEWRAYRDAALALYDVEREIEQEAASKRKSGMGQKVLPSLIAKRDRLLREVEPLKAAADAAERAAMERIRPSSASLQATQPMAAPMPRRNTGVDDLDIPDFLRRQS